jgi:hypothetical protein
MILMAGVSDWCDTGTGTGSLTYRYWYKTSAATMDDGWEWETSNGDNSITGTSYTPTLTYTPTLINDPTPTIIVNDNQTWVIWNNYYYVLPPEIREIRDTERQRLAAAVATIEQAAAAARVERQQADERAEVLLRSSLNPRQLEQFQRDRCFTVISKDGQRQYRIRKGWAHNVERIDNTGKRLHTLCAHPIEPVPEYDNMLTQKLFLEHAEEDFLRMANVRRV